MSGGQLIRRSGVALILGGTLWGVGEIGWGLLVLSAGDPTEYPQPAATVLWVAALSGFIFILLGLPGLYATQAGRARTLGLIGFIVLFVGEALMTGVAYFGAFLQHGVAELIVEAEAAGVIVEEPVMAIVGYLVAYLFHLLGWILFGVASLRARVVPRWPVVLTMVGPLLLFLASGALGESPPAVIALQPMVGVIGIAWLGVALARIGGREGAGGVTASEQAAATLVHDIGQSEASRVESDG